MVKMRVLLEEKKVIKINELEKDRYLFFLSNSYKNHLEHAKFVREVFPRWSIISGYYAMHDISKLLLVKEFNLKVEREVHATTIKSIRELINNKEIFKLFEVGYDEFANLALDLNEAKKEKVKTQYYTGSEYMKDELMRKSKGFIEEIVEPYLLKLEKLLGEKK